MQEKKLSWIGFYELHFLPRDQKISSRQRITRGSGVRDSETFYRVVDRKC